MKNNWTNVIPPVADHPTDKYKVKFLLRLKPIDSSSPHYANADEYARTGVFRTCLAFELGKFTQLPWEWQPQLESGCFDDPEPSTIPPNIEALMSRIDDLRGQNAILHGKLTYTTQQLTGILEDLKLPY